MAAIETGNLEELGTSLKEPCRINFEQNDETDALVVNYDVHTNTRCTLESVSLPETAVFPGLASNTGPKVVVVPGQAPKTGQEPVVVSGLAPNKHNFLNSAAYQKGNTDVTDTGDGPVKWVRKRLVGRRRVTTKVKVTGITTDDAHTVEDAIHHLIKTTSPGLGWRQALLYILEECPSETDTKQVLAFLEANVRAGITAVRFGQGTHVHIDDNSIPFSLRCSYWISIMDGLRFELTSPDTVRQIEYVDVAVGTGTDELALKGFCYLINALTSMLWSNLQLLFAMNNEQGEQLFVVLRSLNKGLNVEPDKEKDLVVIDHILPSLMTSLGFQREDDGSLQWQMPADKEEFVRLYHAIHGLFRPIYAGPIATFI